MEKSKIQYGKSDVLPSKIDAKDVTVQISLKVEEDLLDALRARASKLGLGYQTLMKQMLREKISEEQEDVSERLKRLEHQMKSLLSTRKNSPRTKRIKRAA